MASVAEFLPFTRRTFLVCRPSGAAQFVTENQWLAPLAKLFRRSAALVYAESAVFPSPLSCGYNVSIREEQPIVAGGPWSDFDSVPTERPLLSLRAFLRMAIAMAVLLAVGTIVLCVGIWCFAGIRA